MAGLIIALVVAGIFGTFVGSFLNVCIHRLPRNESIVAPGSKCYSCGTHVAWYDNIPVISYLVLWGRCRWCGATFSIRYLVIEVLVGLLCAGVVFCLRHYDLAWLSPFLLAIELARGHQPGQIYLLVMAAVAGGAILSLVFYLVVATLTDLAYLIIPDELTKSFQVLAPFLAVLCGTNMQTFGLNQQQRPDEGLFNLLPISFRWMVPPGTQGIHGWSLIGHELVISFFGTLLLVLSLPLANRIYSRWVPLNQRWKEGDYRSFAVGVAWFTGSLTLTTIIITLLCIFTLLNPHSPQVVWMAWLAMQLSQAAMGALTGFGSLYVVGLLGTVLFRRSAMGYGDVKFLAPIGCFLGPLGVVMAFFLAALFGSLVGLPMRLMRAQRELPFGPYLAMGALTVLVCGPRLLEFLNELLKTH
jgi:prepilin signal peptidase PulO-like enzyme (type II secretory pathway)